MAIEKRGTDSWRVIIYEGYSNGKKQRRTKTIHGRRSDAEREEKIMLGEIAKQPAKFTNQMKLNDFFQYWLNNFADEHLAPKTVFEYTKLFRRIDAALGHKALDKIEPKHLLLFYANLKEAPRLDGRLGGLGENSIRKHHVFLHLLLEKAKRWGFIYINPADNVDPPAFHYRNNKKIFTLSELNRFMDLLKGETLKHRLWVLLGISLGLRKGEMFGLQWKHVNYKEKTLLISQSAQYLPQRGVFIKSTKNVASNRNISMPDVLVECLIAYEAQQKEIAVALSNKWEGTDIANWQDNYVFTTWNGHLAHPDSINSWLNKFVRRHGLPHISPHSFRHMTATYLINAGVDLTTVAGKLGHSNSTTTQVIYSHLLKQSERETANMMDDILMPLAIPNMNDSDKK
ncbi:site-specific integrase [Pectinatus haikarae]|uniref:Integrase n=1 Tax=Pectinatus haikarae TaxID=349096 RepID=A0ABT9Y4T3_9FIRM|nr:tyrosine-type recombinase/integrase [Pectinatus haikarae]MDQ0202837.1 integrase [Pectinatus haikarae]